ncbi:HhH-GDP family DNA glycosylase [Rhodococcus chondri]|uniref:Endonuclease n=1 Tax=Rhodococcus chondri TaxID=3065941 RepID=A0ABU7JYS7_9NOCA|nr:endonuclease [Rhodococcus sp. CC-R104]MEE2034957.1 endonuclease [Rhodococcus sp. CC-R104]
MDTVKKLLDLAGRTYADDAGITLKDTPKPLFQLLVLALLSSTRISADIAVSAARELFHAGWRTPKAIADAPRAEVIAALGRGHYARYDESTATRLRELGGRVESEYHGDLRELARRSDEDPTAAARLLQEFNGIGSVGAQIFLREVQNVWTWVRPYFDKRSEQGAEQLGLPTIPKELAKLAPNRHVATLAAALVRVTLDDELRNQVRD